jgi:hypothetical protein
VVTAVLSSRRTQKAQKILGWTQAFATPNPNDFKRQDGLLHQLHGCISRSIIAPVDHTVAMFLQGKASQKLWQESLTIEGRQENCSAVSHRFDQRMKEVTAWVVSNCKVRTCPTGFARQIPGFIPSASFWSSCSRSVSLCISRLDP